MPPSNSSNGQNGRPTICQVLHSLEVGGAEVLAARLARGLADRYRFCFVCLDELGALGASLREGGLDVAVLRRRPGVDMVAAGRLAEILRRQRVDVLHAHQYTPFFYAMTARVLCQRPAILFTEHGRWFPDYRRPKRVAVNRLLLQRRDRVVGVGQAVRRAVIENEGIARRRVGVIYNGIDLTPFGNGVSQRTVVRREFGWQADELVLVQVARLDPLKDHATALRALGRLVQRGLQARLVLVGDGPTRRALEEQIQAGQLQSHVDLLGVRRDVPRLLCGADVLLLSSVSEGIPLTLIEGMAAGLPVVSTDVGGVREIVEPDGTALLAPSGDDAALAEQITRLAQAPELRRQMGLRGRQRAWELFSEQRMHDGYRRLYAEMLGD